MKYYQYEPKADFDIALLKGAQLPKGKRFETRDDNKNETIRRLKRIGQRASRNLVQSLTDCLDGHYHCEMPGCPQCASDFRRWLVGSSLPLFRRLSGPKHAVVILLDHVNSLHQLAITKTVRALRKRLERHLGDAIAFGGLEICWDAPERKWLPHANFTLAHTTKTALLDLKERLDLGSRGFHVQLIDDDVKWQSYLLKFFTYQRPFEQFGSHRSRAIPMNVSQEIEYLEFVSEKNFPDFLLLRNIRRYGFRLEETLSSRNQREIT